MNRHLFIIATSFQNITGGLIWTKKLAEHAKNVYQETTVLDLSKEHAVLRKTRFLEIIRYLILFLLRGNYFVFIDHRLHLRFGLPLLLSYFLKKNRYATICHHVFYEIKSNRLRKPIEYLSEMIFLKNAQFVVVPSKKTALDVQNLGVDQKKIIVINPTHTINSNKIPQREFRNKILFVGNLEPRKGVDTIIKALSLIKDLDFSFDIIGGYENYKNHFLYLKNLVTEYNVSDKITFHGRINSEKLVEFYRNANVFVFASRHEGYGTVLLEAMSFGLPVVAADIPTTREIIKQNVNGYLCPVDDVDCLLQKIRKLLGNRSLQTKMGTRNFKNSRKFRNWNQVIEETFSWIQPHLFQTYN